MARPDVMDHETMTVVLDYVTGDVSLEGEPPAATAWTPDLLALLRRNGSLWCSIRQDPDGDVIEMRLKPETIWYRLTGEIDDFGGQIADRCDAEGAPWPTR